MTETNLLNEQLSAAAFTRQSAVFDALYSPNTIIQYKRERVRDHVNKYLQPGSTMLELNAGTGEDAIYFASQGHKVHATDIAAGMLAELRKKVSAIDVSGCVTDEQCSFNHLDALQNKGPYDIIFSNFAGLNCTSDLSGVLRSFKPLLREGGLVSLVILPPFCLWETLMLFRGKFRTAFRRMNSTNGAQAHVEGVHFKCWYYKPSFIIDVLKEDFELLEVEGLCTVVPPSYIEGFAEKHPKIYRKLTSLEARWKNKWPWRNIGDYYIITLRKK